jgi:hypothetical protein
MPQSIAHLPAVVVDFRLTALDRLQDLRDERRQINGRQEPGDEKCGLF